MISSGYSQVLFSKKYKLIIGCHARCWSKSMINWFPKLEELHFDEINHSTVANCKEISLWGYDDEYIKYNFNHYKVYFFIRNPFERFYSHILAHQIYQDVSFLEATRYINENNKWPASIYNIYSKKIIDNLSYELIEFDDIRERIFKIKEELDIDIDFEVGPYTKEYHQLENYEIEGEVWNLKISEINKIPCHCSIPDYKLVYNDEISNLVYNYYKKDFEFFNYSRDFKIKNVLK